MDTVSERRLKRAKEVCAYSAQMRSSEFALPADIAALNEQYVLGTITFLEKAGELEALYGLTISEQLLRENACTQSSSSIALEGFTLDPGATLLNERYIAGEIDLQEKLRLIKRLYLGT